MSRNKRILYGLASAGILVLLWIVLPADPLPPEAWGVGFKVRFIGFAAIGLLAFYFFFDKVLSQRKKE